MEKLINYIKSDLYRYNRSIGYKSFIKTYLTFRLYRLMFWYRVAVYLKQNKVFFISFVAHRIYKRICLSCGVDLPVTVKIGYGCKINHGFGLVVNSRTVLGNNVTLMHNLTFSNEKGKAPVVGDNVRFTPGGVIVGGVYIGNNSVIGANCVVTSDVPDNDIAVGVPNRNLGRKYKEEFDRYYWDILESREFN